MYNLIVKLFIKNSSDIHSPKVREAYGTFSGIFGIVTNLILFSLKFTIGLISGSISILADATNNLADSASSILTIIGFKLSSKPADEDHPFGHERMEYLTGLGISVFILFIGFEFLTSSFKKIFSPEIPHFGSITFIVLTISIIGKLLQGLFYKKTGKLIKSDTLIAASADSFNDVIATSAVLLSTIISFKTGIVLDGFIGIAVSLFILYSGVKLVIETANPLIGTVPDSETVDKISKKITECDIILGIHDLVIHSYGANKCFASVHAEVDAGSDITKVHDTIDIIEREFLTDLGINLVIHMDPIVTDSPEVDYSRNAIAEILSKISTDISMHDFRIVTGETHTNLIFDVCIPYSFKMSESELKQKIFEEAKEVNPKWYTVVTIDRDFNGYSKR